MPDVPSARRAGTDLLRRFDLDLLRLGVRGLREGQREDAVLDGRPGPVGVDGAGQCDLADVLARSDLMDEPRRTVRDLMLIALRAEGQDAALELDVDALGRDPWN